MNKKIISIILICLLTCTMVGCDRIANSNSSTNNGPISYKNKFANSRFKVISTERVDNGDISIIVDKETKVMYLQTEKYQQGYGLGLQVMVNKDGKPLLYNGDLQ